MSGDYENLYGVGLLDDLHNYFPDLLYNTSSFASVPQVLGYMQSQTRQRFDLFSRGMNAYRQTQQRTTVPPPSFQARADFFYTPPTAVRHRFNETVPVDNIHTRVMGNLNRRTIAEEQQFFNLLNALLGGLPMTNVIVRPTSQQINAATTLSTVSTPINDVCAVCQDGYEVGNEKRSLNVCHHSFHRGCIDTWFQENVHCPVCRHDIREAVMEGVGTRATSATPPTD